MKTFGSMKTHYSFQEMCLASLAYFSAWRTWTRSHLYHSQIHHFQSIKQPPLI